MYAAWCYICGSIYGVPFVSKLTKWVHVFIQAVSIHNDCLCHLDWFIKSAATHFVLYKGHASIAVYTGAKSQSHYYGC